METNQKTFEKQTIEIGCAPGPLRPDHYLKQVLEGTGIEESDCEKVAMSFGDWEWEISEEKTALYLEKKGIIKERLTALYESHRIRYASW